MPNLPPPETATATNLGLLLSVDGEAIGASFEWAPTQQRATTMVYEFGGVTEGAATGPIQGPGEAYEVVPGNITGTTIQLRRYDLFAKPFERAFGRFDLTMLSKQNRAIKANEFLLKPDNTSDVQTYWGCWFSNKGKQHSAQQDRLIVVSATLAYCRVTIGL